MGLINLSVRRVVVLGMEFGDLDLYAVLQIDKDVPQPAIRKAYLRRCLRTHPDKTGGDDTEFRQVSFAHSVLSNEAHRREYDESGKTDFRGDAVIADLFSRDFRVEITEDMIEEDRKAYQHSVEERRDLLALYKRFDGDFDRITESLIHSTPEDFDRLISMLEEGFEAKEITRTPKFKKTTAKARMTKRKNAAAAEAKQVEADRKRLGLDSEAGLAALIQQRQQKRSGLGGVIEQLEAKYAVTKPKKGERRRAKK